MKLHLKPEFTGLIISRTLPGVGTITFNSITVAEAAYSNYANTGFADLFTTECVNGCCTPPPATEEKEEGKLPGKNLKAEQKRSKKKENFNNF